MLFCDEFFFLCVEFLCSHWSVWLMPYPLDFINFFVDVLIFGVTQEILFLKYVIWELNFWLPTYKQGKPKKQHYKSLALDFTLSTL